MPAVTVKYDKLTVECRSCRRLVYNGGSCRGRSGLLNICLAYISFKYKSYDEGNNGI